MEFENRAPATRAVRRAIGGGTMIRTLALAGLLLGTLLAGCAPSLPENTPVTEARWLDQNWNDHERHWFHHANQGTATLPVPYAWFLALEQPDIWVFSEPQLLSDSDYLRRFGFIPSPPDVAGDAEVYGYAADAAGREVGSEGEYDRAAYGGNPDALPVGFVRNGEDIGFTCAACHTGHLEYRGVSLRIDGAPAMTDLGKLREIIGLSLVYTRYVPFRFGRFAERVLGPGHSDAQAQALSDQLDALLDKGKAIKAIQDPVFEANVEEGFTRLDALNRIGNQVFFIDLLGAPDGFDASRNLAPVDAPVNYPHIWDTAWFTWVQYDSSIMQPMVCNAGEALGVSARVNLTKPGDTLYDSEVEVREIYQMEKLLAGDDPFSGDTPGFKGLRAPNWPEELLGAIDSERRERGRKLYTQLCQGCHLPPVEGTRFWNPTLWTTPNSAGERYLKVKSIPLSLLGTDPAQAEVLTERKVALPAYLGVRNFAPVEGSDVLCQTTEGEAVTETLFGVALADVVEKTVTRWYDNEGVPPDQRAELNGNRPNCIQAELMYKVRPLDGIWATAPFLHNGSVPTLWDLLLPAEQRPAKFCLGSRLFNPKEVGYSTDCVSGSFELDTAIPGNRNGGHEFKDGPLGDGIVGRALSDEERWDLIEYMKSL